MPSYLVRFCQVHDTFRVPELTALAVVEDVLLEITEYIETSPFCLITVPDDDAARRLVQRSLLVAGVHEFWAEAPTIEELKDRVHTHEYAKRPDLECASFKFAIDAFQGTRDRTAQRDIIASFVGGLPFKGPVEMNTPDEQFTVFEAWPENSFARGITAPDRVFFGRQIGVGARELAKTYDLKKRSWISTTSMDAELALISANIALAGPGKVFFDPFCGTGSFPVACAHFGALSFGADIDGRAMRGQGGRSARANFSQYGIESCFGDMFSADITNTPVCRRIFDGIVCDMPYGVREGLRVLGNKEGDPVRTTWNGKGKPPMKPYSFFCMLDDMLDFATATLVDGGRLAFWMPAWDDVETEYPVPLHPSLELLTVSTQTFSKWSRRLIVYSRRPDIEAVGERVRVADSLPKPAESTADALNPFRRSYFNAKAEARDA